MHPLTVVRLPSSRAAAPLLPLGHPVNARQCEDIGSAYLYATTPSMFTGAAESSFGRVRDAVRTIPHSQRNMACSLLRLIMDAGFSRVTLNSYVSGILTNISPFLLVQRWINKIEVECLKLCGSVLTCTVLLCRCACLCMVVTATHTVC